MPTASRKSTTIFSLRSLFNQFAKWGARFAGHPTAFGLAVLAIILWAGTGPLFHFSDTWQLVINTGTTIITFLMVFLIQNTQNRDMTATHIKIDELIRAIEGANNALLDLEELEESDLEKLRSQYEDFAGRARALLRKGKSSTGCGELEDPNAHLKDVPPPSTPLEPESQAHS
jgi:low affinity Fe/Cu permease